MRRAEGKRAIVAVLESGVSPSARPVRGSFWSAEYGQLVKLLDGHVADS
jgi:hypothetical protein